MLKGRSATLALAIMAPLLSQPAIAQDKPFQGVTLNVASIKWDFMETLLGVYAKQAAEDLGIDLRVSWFTYEGHRNKLVADNLANVPTWDLVYVDMKQLPEFAGAGILEPLDGKFSAEFDQADFSGYAIDSVTYEGNIYAVPFSADPNGLVYRKDLFENAEEQAAFKAKYGYDLVVPTNYTQYRDVAEFFTRKSGEKLAGEVLQNDFYGSSQSNKVPDFLWQDYISYMKAFGGEVYDTATMKPTWNGAGSVEAGRLYASLAPFWPPAHINMTSGESMSEFDKGRVAMIIEYYSRIVYLGNPATSAITGKFDYALLPTAREDRPHATLAHVNSLGIYGKSRQKKAALALLQKIMGKEVAKAWALHEPTESFRAGNPLFPRNSVLSDAALLAKFPSLALVAATLDGKSVYAFGHYRIVEYPEIVEIVTTAVSNTLTGAPVDDQFNEAQAKLESLFDQAGYGKQ